MSMVLDLRDLKRDFSISKENNDGNAMLICFIPVQNQSLEYSVWFKKKPDNNLIPHAEKRKAKFTNQEQ